MRRVEQCIPLLTGGISEQPFFSRDGGTSLGEENTLPMFGFGVVKRPPAVVVARLGDDTGDGYWCRVRLGGNSFIGMLAGDRTVFFDERGEKQEVVFLNEGSKTYLAGGDFHFVEHAGKTLVLNKNCVVRLKADATRSPHPRQSLVWVREALRGASYRVEVFLETAEDKGRFERISEVIHKEAEGGDTQDLVRKLFAPSVLKDNGFAIDYQGSKALLRREDGKRFHVKTSDGHGDRSVVVIGEEITDFGILPPRGFDGFVTKVARGKRDEGYYLKYDSYAGVWVEWKDLKAQDGLLDEDTLPHVLEWDDATNKICINVGKWCAREVGDEKSAPPPCFVDFPIVDMFFYQGRLAFVVADGVSFSEAEAIYNFWRTTAKQVLDSDPLDMTIAHETAPRIHSGVVTGRGDILLLGTQSQYLLKVRGALAPKSVSFTRAGSYGCAAIKPVSLLQGLVFSAPQSVSQAAFFWDLSDESTVAAPMRLTEKVPTLLPKVDDFWKWVSIPGENLLVGVPKPRQGASEEDVSKKLYVHRHYVEGSTLFSAWTVWRFSKSIVALEGDETSLWIVFSEEANPCQKASLWLTRLRFGENKFFADFQTRLEGGDYREAFDKTEFLYNGPAIALSSLCLREEGGEVRGDEQQRACGVSLAGVMESCLVGERYAMRLRVPFGVPVGGQGEASFGYLPENLLVQTCQVCVRGRGVILEVLDQETEAVISRIESQQETEVVPIHYGARRSVLEIRDVSTHENCIGSVAWRGTYA